MGDGSAITKAAKIWPPEAGGAAKVLELWNWGYEVSEIVKITGKTEAAVNQTRSYWGSKGARLLTRRERNRARKLLGDGFKHQDFALLFDQEAAGELEKARETVAEREPRVTFRPPPPPELPPDFTIKRKGTWSPDELRARLYDRVKALPVPVDLPEARAQLAELKTLAHLADAAESI